MSVPPPTDLPQSGRRSTIWPNLVWAIPTAALIVVAYLGLQAFVHRGETVTVTFRRAAGARAGETKVLYQGVEAGELVKILPNADGRSLDFKLRLAPEAKAGLNSNARFWLIGADANLTDLNSIKAVVAGVAVGYAPGEGGTPATHFEGLERAPIVLPDDRGTRYVLHARTLSSVQEGTIVLFRGQAIGKVADVKFAGKAGFRLEIFLYQPYDSLVHPGAHFWKISPLRLSFTSGGITANMAPISTLLSGGVELEVDQVDAASPVSKADAEFTLYSSRNAARQGLSGPGVRYEFAFYGASDHLDENAAVNLLGFQIGEVESSHLDFDARSGEPFTVATALIYPQQLHLDVDAGADPNGQAATDAKLRLLARAGYRAKLEQSPPLLGDASIALAKVKNASAAELIRQDGPPRFPSVAGSGLDDLTAQAGQILAKVNSLPIEQIGKNVGQMTMRLNSLLASPDLTEGLAHLKSTLKEVDQMLADVQPKVGPLIDKLNSAAAQLSDTARLAHRLLDDEGGSESDSVVETIRQLNEAARSVHTLTDYLGRHPEALIRGKRSEP